MGDGSLFECRGRVVGIRALYTGNLMFESQSAYRPSLEVYRIFLRFIQKKNAEIVPHIAVVFSATYSALLIRTVNTTYREHRRVYHKRNKNMSVAILLNNTPHTHSPRYSQQPADFNDRPNRHLSVQLLARHA
jgi:hypothetical protein